MTAEIRNCEFRFQCPKTWDALQPTEDLNIRFCKQCQRTVHYCHTPTQLHKAIVNNQCVAVEIHYARADPVDIMIGEIDPPTYRPMGQKST